jgi:hypothetical protein
MKEQILKVAQDLEKGTITENEAKTLLLGLFGVSNCYDRADMKYAYNADKDWQSFDKFIEEYDAPI